MSEIKRMGDVSDIDENILAELQHREPRPFEMVIAEDIRRQEHERAVAERDRIFGDIAAHGAEVTGPPAPHASTPEIHQ